MKLSEASYFFTSLISKTDKKSELRIYKKFANIISDLQTRNFTPEQLKSIEDELESLDLKAKPENRKKHLNRKLSKFSNFLNTEFSLVTEGYYMMLGMVFGMIFGQTIGLSLGIGIGGGSGTAIGLSMGTGFGMAMGIAFGAAKDAAAKKQNRVLKTK